MLSLDHHPQAELLILPVELDKMARIFYEQYNSIFKIQNKTRITGHVHDFTPNAQLLRTVMPTSLHAGIDGLNTRRLNAGWKKNK
jgi:hypothetical protein